MCSAETRFIPEKGADCQVDLHMLSLTSCSMTVGRFVPTPEGQVKRKAVPAAGKGCIKR